MKHQSLERVSGSEPFAWALMGLFAFLASGIQGCGASSGAAPSESSPVDFQPIVLTFSTLAFYRYALPTERISRETPTPLKGQIPAEIKALNGKKITIEGFMIPLDMNKGKIQSFYLSRAMIRCCLADSVRINEVIKVAPADGKPVDYFSVARVTGTLEVGEEIEDGYLVSLYRLKADQVSDVQAK